MLTFRQVCRTGLKVHEAKHPLDEPMVPLLSLLALFLFGLTLAVLFADVLAAGIVRPLQRLGVLPPPVVRFDGLLEELHRLWPLEEDGQDEEEILAKDRAALEKLLRAA